MKDERAGVVTKELVALEPQMDPFCVDDGSEY